MTLWETNTLSKCLQKYPGKQLSPGPAAGLPDSINNKKHHGPIEAVASCHYTEIILTHCIQQTTWL
jgi:hypothetical protein